MKLLFRCLAIQTIERLNHTDSYAHKHSLPVYYYGYAISDISISQPCLNGHHWIANFPLLPQVSLCDPHLACVSGSLPVNLRMTEPVSTKLDAYTAAREPFSATYSINFSNLCMLLSKFSLKRYRGNEYTSCIRITSGHIVSYFPAVIFNLSYFLHFIPNRLSVRWPLFFTVLLLVIIIVLVCLPISLSNQGECNVALLRYLAFQVWNMRKRDLGQDRWSSYRRLLFVAWLNKICIPPSFIYDMYCSYAVRLTVLIQQLIDMGFTVRVRKNQNSILGLETYRSE
jgi:hypothetical protein